MLIMIQIIFLLTIEKTVEKSLPIFHHWRYKFIKGSVKGYSSTTYHYGSKGIESSNNHPPARMEHTSCKCSNDVFYMFGGRAWVWNSIRDTNDLWKMNITSKKWTWLSGYEWGAIGGSYGSSYSLMNYPGSREDSRMICYDDDHLVLFGGFDYHVDYNELNDLWWYRKSTNEWKWDYGAQGLDQRPVYSVMGSYNAGNIIGGRNNFLMLYLKNTDELIIHGGWCLGAACCAGINNDLWFYDFNNPGILKWARGSSSLDPTGSYVNHDFDNSNEPGGRQGHVGYILPSKDAFLLFGGEARDKNWQLGPMNDLFIYNITTNLFKWAKGSSMIDQVYSVYVQKGEFSRSNIPGGKENSFIAPFFDYENLIMIYGGIGTDIRGYDGFSNDIWLLDIDTLEFAFLSGNDISDTYGIYNTEYNKINRVGGRMYPIAYTYGKSNMIIYGGLGCDSTSCAAGAGPYNILNDLWIGRFAYICFGILEDSEGVCNYHGNCISDDVCSCYDHFYGIQCEHTECYGYLSNTDHVCSNGNGKCVDHDVCQCNNYKKFDGKYCEIHVCNEVKSTDKLVCNERGVCTKNHTCKCNKGFYGIKCETENFAERLTEEYWYIFSIAIPIILVIFCFLIVICCSCSCCVIQRQKGSIKRYELLKDDLDILLKEQKVKRSSNTPSFKMNEKLFLLDYDTFEFKKALQNDDGSLSMQYLVVWNGHDCVFKCYKLNIIFSDEGSYKIVENEIQVLSNLKHPHIVQFYGAALKLGSKVGVLLEYMERGNVRNMLIEFRKDHHSMFPVVEKLRILKEIASALRYCHSLKIIHRDLQPENVLVNKAFESKIGDFGFAKVIERVTKVQNTQRVGKTVWYRSPEIINQPDYTDKVDVYSYGIVIYTIMTEKFYNPFDNTNVFSHEKKLLIDPLYRPKVDMKYFSQCKWVVSLMKQCWGNESDSRPDFNQILKVLKSETVLTTIIKDEKLGKENEDKYKMKYLQSQKELKRLELVLSKLSKSKK